MFYSQFILAKKGPLGTIWIAAHLERKLRKNQVADTDVGVSVDSILSPDVPIALRLSSHLLLGVVRIYSRKVTYLFDDCSEALLKVKQAFRSAAVDLPPEEARAPYHSITLPETFDLDDFELPENDITHGRELKDVIVKILMTSAISISGANYTCKYNFLDHHISSREQITLQDNIDGSSYSTSKFGLDERFGDGDVSGLELDEELLLDNIGSAGYANERSDLQASVGTVITLTQDEHLETTTMNPGTMVEDDDDGDDPMDYAQAPSTPGLVEEPNLSNAREVSDHLETQRGLVQSTMTGSAKNINYGDKQEVSWCSHNNAESDAIHIVLMEENGDTSDGLNVNLSKESGESPAEANSKHFSVGDSSLESKHTSDLSRNTDLELASKSKDNHHGSNEIFWDKESACGISEEVSAKDQGLLATEVPNSVEIASSGEKSCPAYSDYASKNQDGSFNIDVRVKVTSTEDLFLRPCNFMVEQPDITSGYVVHAVPIVEQPDITSGYVVHAVPDVQSNVAALETSGREETIILGKERCIIDSSEGTLKENHIQEHAALEDIHAASGEPNSQVHNANSHDGLIENLNSFTKTELPAPEKLLSVPECHVDLHQNMLVEVSPKPFVGHGESNAVRETISGKKRSFTGSTLTDQSLNSMESSRLVRCKRTVESDDDLLSSILAGRSSVLKVKPTPRLSKATSMKRTCSAPRHAPKRKVLMDDTMVLHGDSIRQQLTNTEGIRRVRKKAPCTLPEISSIQKQYLEDGFFLEPLFTGNDYTSVYKDALLKTQFTWKIQPPRLEDLHEPLVDLMGIADIINFYLQGMSLELVSLHSQACDLSGITVVKNDLNGASLESVPEMMLPSENDENVNRLESIFEPTLASHDMKNDHSLATSFEPNVTSQNDELKEDYEMNEEINLSGEMTKPTTDMEAVLLQRGVLLDVTEVQTSEENDNRANSTDTSRLEPLYSIEDASLAGIVQPGSITETVDTNTCDLSGIAVVKNDLNGASLEPVPEMMLPSENDENVNLLESMFEPTLASHDVKNDHSLATSFEPNVTSQNDEMKEDYEMNEEIDLSGEMTKPTTDMEAVLLQRGVSLDVTGVQTRGENDNRANSTDTSRLEPLYSIEDASLAGIVQPGSITETVDTNTCVNAGASAVLHAEKTDIPLIELDSAVKDVDNGQATSNSELSTGKDGDINDGFENEPEARGDVLPEVLGDGITSELHGDKLGKQFIMVHSSVNNGENPEPPEVYQQSTMDAEIHGFDPHDQEEFKYSAAGNDTEFLNVDDDELNEIAEDRIPDDDYYEEAQFTEYTGWSSRTRAVSRYLQTLFVKEVEFGRESLSMDNLLIGKSRKEASRMFFEALVLKTRDYIQVEQSNPYNDITIKPRTKLMKYDF
ncbi:hypothetical protein OROGR_025943 [Orobanche gracilis]